MHSYECVTTKAQQVEFVRPEFVPEPLEYEGKFEYNKSTQFFAKYGLFAFSFISKQSWANFNGEKRGGASLQVH